MAEKMYSGEKVLNGVLYMIPTQYISQSWSASRNQHPHIGDIGDIRTFYGKGLWPKNNKGKKEINHAEIVTNNFHIIFTLFETKQFQ